MLGVVLPRRIQVSVRHSSAPSALPALTTARRSHDRPHDTSPSTEAPLPLMSSNNSSAVDRVIRLFQAHGLSENSLCMCSSVNARVSCLEVTSVALRFHFALIFSYLETCRDFPPALLFAITFESFFSDFGADVDEGGIRT